MSWYSLRPARWSDHKVNICHRLIVEHDWIPTRTHKNNDCYSGWRHLGDAWKPPRASLSYTVRSDYHSSHLGWSLLFQYVVKTSYFSVKSTQYGRIDLSIDVTIMVHWIDLHFFTLSTFSKIYGHIYTFVQISILLLGFPCVFVWIRMTSEWTERFPLSNQDVGIVTF